MNINLQHFQKDSHKDVLILQKVYNFIFNRSKNRLGAPEGPYILTQLDEAIMSFRIQKPQDQQNYTSEQIKEMIKESLKYLTYEKKEEKRTPQLKQIDSLMLELLKH